MKINTVTKVVLFTTLLYVECFIAVCTIGLAGPTYATVLFGMLD